MGAVFPVTFEQAVMTASWSQNLHCRLDLLASARHLLVCTDYDGTIAPLASSPTKARMLPGAFEVLHGLACLPETRVAVVSGRSLEDLRHHSKFDLPVLLVGSHGAEFSGHAPYDVDALVPTRLDAIESALAIICASANGVWIERKPFGMAVHVRQAQPAVASQALEQVRIELARWPGVHLKNGKAVIELSLSQIGKGDAVQRLRDDWGTSPQVLYLGDDVTDEDAFRVLRPTDVGVKVGIGSSKAEYRVASEHAVLPILNRLRLNRASIMNDGLTENKLKA